MPRTLATTTNPCDFRTPAGHCSGAHEKAAALGAECYSGETNETLILTNLACSHAAAFIFCLDFGLWSFDWIFFFRNPKVGHLDYFNRLFDCFNTVCFNVFQFFEFTLKFGFGILDLRRLKPICLIFIDFHPFSFIFTHFDSLQSILIHVRSFARIFVHYHSISSQPHAWHLTKICLPSGKSILEYPLQVSISWQQAAHMVKLTVVDMSCLKLQPTF